MLAKGWRVHRADVAAALAFPGIRLIGSGGTPAWRGAVRRTQVGMKSDAVHGQQRQLDASRCKELSENTMRQTNLLLSVLLAAWIGLSPVGPSFAANPDLATPEDAIAAYVEGVAHRDFAAIFAATSVVEMSRKFDFEAYVDRLRVLNPMAPAPTGDAFFIEINKADFSAQIARQVRFLAYGLMTIKEILDGKTIQMDAAGAADFASAVRADRLAGLALVKVGIPNPRILNSEKHQANVARIARVYGADGLTDRLALLSFEGLHFAIGFSLLRYGDDWTVWSQSSSIAGTNPLGSPRRVTPEEFAEMLR